MSKEFRLFPPGAPGVSTDKFIFSRVDGTSPTGFSNYLLTLSELAIALGISFTLEFLIGNGIDVITVGLKPTAVIVTPRAGIITGWTILSADSVPTPGSIVIDLYKDTYANYPPTAIDTITGSAKPTISGDIKATSTILTGWITSFAKNDILIPNVDSITSLKAVKVLIAYSIP